MKLFMVMLIAGAFFAGMGWYLMRDRTAWGPESEHCKEITDADADLEDSKLEDGKLGFGAKIDRLFQGCE